MDSIVIRQLSLFCILLASGCGGGQEAAKTPSAEAVKTQQEKAKKDSFESYEIMKKNTPPGQPLPPPPPGYEEAPAGSGK